MEEKTSRQAAKLTRGFLFGFYGEPQFVFGCSLLLTLHLVSKDSCCFCTHYAKAQCHAGRLGKVLSAL